ncbi:MAG: PadR family transcriptional regulator [Oscillibacter sp.]|nr:PadR family transcriptional regulator [Oscillibacter sp.]MBQ4550106.1 PadR family transcriptional regulator [Oscillospiraceae bacterium]
MEDRFLQQMKKGVLEMLVLETVCDRATYGYELLGRLREGSGGLFALKEGTLYPILYRLEDDGFVTASWSAGEGRTAPKKIYTATDAGRAEAQRRRALWVQFAGIVDGMGREKA